MPLLIRHSRDFHMLDNVRNFPNLTRQCLPSLNMRHVHTLLFCTADGYLVVAAAGAAWHLRGGLKWRRTVVPSPPVEYCRILRSNATTVVGVSRMKTQTRWNCQPLARYLVTRRDLAPRQYPRIRAMLNISHETRTAIVRYVLRYLCAPPCNYPPRSAFNDFDVRINSRWLRTAGDHTRRTHDTQTHTMVFIPVPSW